MYVGLLTAFSGIAGFLFGYDTGNISGALPYIRDELLLGYKANGYGPPSCSTTTSCHTSTLVTSEMCRLHWIEGVIVSAAVVGAAFGSACGGALSDSLGRKAALKVADVFFVAGALVMAAAPGAAILVIGAPLFKAPVSNFILSRLYKAGCRYFHIILEICSYHGGHFSSLLLQAGCSWASASG